MISSILKVVWEIFILPPKKAAGTDAIKKRIEVFLMYPLFIQFIVDVKVERTLKKRAVGGICVCSSFINEKYARYAEAPPRPLAE
jgi:hypothetical protein